MLHSNSKQNQSIVEMTGTDKTYQINREHIEKKDTTSHIIEHSKFTHCATTHHMFIMRRTHRRGENVS